VKITSEMNYTVSSGALNSTPTNQVLVLIMCASSCSVDLSKINDDDGGDDKK